MNKKEKQESLIAKLASTLAAMQEDPRCLEDTAFENAVQKLHKLLQAQRKALTEMETAYFNSKGLDFKQEIDQLNQQADHLQDLLDKGSDTIKIVGAIEDIIKFFHPLI